MVLPINQVLLGDAIEVLKSLPDSSVDAVVTDPPYGMGVAAWDVKIDIAAFTHQVKRVCKGFYAFFGQMPTLLDWAAEAETQRLHYCEHITWVKRNNVPVHAKRLTRGHEDILIYSTGKLRQFHEVNGRYEDVRFPGVLVDIATLESVGRYISALRSKLRHGGNADLDLSHGKRQELFGSPTRFLSTSCSGDRSSTTCNYSNVWSFLPVTFSQGRRNKQSGIHPTEKPLEVMKRLVEMCSPRGGTVLDPFLGSGTTAVACLETDRHFIGIEKNPDYQAISQQRIANALPLDLAALQQNLARLGRELTEAQILELLSKAA